MVFTATRGMRGVRITVAVASALVLALTGLSWWFVSHTVAGFTMSSALGLTYPHSGAGAMNILLIGLDSRKDQDGNNLPREILDKLHAGDSESGGNNTNTLILVHVSLDNHVVAFSIPRDDYVPVAGIPGYSHVKIKQAYGLKKADTEQKLAQAGVSDQHELETQGREAGRAATVAAVRGLTGAPIDYFAEISLAGFYDLTAALGGVDVCLNHPASDDYSGANFPAGGQALNAEQALAFVRQRHGLVNGDLDRTRRQQAFLISIMRKLHDGAFFTDLDRLNKLISVAHKDIVLSSGWSDEQFRRIGDIAGGNVQYRTLPVARYATVDGQDVNIVDPDAVKADVAAAFDDSATATTQSAPSSTVDVLYAGGAEGVAETIAHELSLRGYTSGQIRNPLTGEPRNTGVDYGPGSASDAQTLGGLIGIGSPPRLDSSQEPGHIRVVLGNDYTLPANFGQSPSVTGAGPGTDPAASDDGQSLAGDATPCVD